MYSPKKNVRESQIKQLLATLYPTIQEKDGYYFLGRERVVGTRKRGERYVSSKQKIAQRLVKLWSYIPSIMFIGLSGSLAAGSATKATDLDFFVITKKDMVFITRFLMLATLYFLGMRKKDSDDVCCLNLFIDEGKLTMPSSRRDIYTAREVVQLKPLFSRNSTYERFMKQNAWVRTYVPNYVKQVPFLIKAEKASQIIRVIMILLRSLETISKILQVIILRKNARQSIQSHGFLAFYKAEYRYHTIEQFEQKMQQIEAYLAGKQKRIIVTPHDIDKEKNIFYTA